MISSATWKHVSVNGQSRTTCYADYAQLLKASCIKAAIPRLQYTYRERKLIGMDMVSVDAHVVTDGATSGLLNIDLALCEVVATGDTCSGTVNDILSTNLTIDVNESKASSAAAAAVIDTSEDDMAIDQVIRVDIDAVHGTAAKGLILAMGFRLP